MSGSRKSFSKIWSTIAWKADYVHKELVVLGEEVEKQNFSCAGNFCLHFLNYYVSNWFVNINERELSLEIGVILGLETEFKF